MPAILIVEDDIAFCNLLTTFLSKRGFETVGVYSFSAAVEKIAAQSFDIILSDVRLPEKEGTAILSLITSKNLASKVILMTGYAEVRPAVDAIKEGAFDYVSKPVAPDKLLSIIYNALEKPQNFPKSNQSSPTERIGQERASYVRGVSDVSKKLDDYIGLVAPTDMSVLVTGHSGTGKEYIARAIHKLSNRNGGPFVPVDCGAIPKEIATSEFFGHLKGSFTGAITNKSGYFEQANGGTLFLDEIGNLDYELQVQLLRVLQERVIRPIGSNKEIGVNIRIVAATNEDMDTAVREGAFREDLYHRLNEFMIKAPQLRDRMEDIPLFADFFLNLANQSLGKQIIGFTDEVSRFFQEYDWPGNLREMQNIVKRAVLLCSDKYIDQSHITVKKSENNQTNDKVPYSLFKNRQEKEFIEEALKKARGNKSQAAKQLGIDRKTLYNKLKQYDIKN